MSHTDEVWRPQRDAPSSLALDRELARLARRQHGVVARAQLLEIGMTEWMIRHRLQTARLRQLHRGVYLVGPVSSPRARLVAGALAVAPEGSLSHRSAGQWWGFIRGETVVPVHVTTPTHLRPTSDLTPHRTRELGGDACVHRGIRVTTVARTLLDLAADLSADALGTAVHEAEVLRLFDLAAIEDAIARGNGRRGARALRDAIAEWQDAPQERSRAEGRLNALIRAAGLPRPQRNVIVALGGRLVEIDFLWRDARLAVEVDGRAVHETRRAFESDRRRDELLTLHGYRPVRFTWRRMRDDPAAVQATLARLLGLG